MSCNKLVDRLKRKSKNLVQKMPAMMVNTKETIYRNNTNEELLLLLSSSSIGDIIP